MLLTEMTGCVCASWRVLALEAKGHISPGADIAYIMKAGEKPLTFLIGEHCLELC